MNNKQTNIWNVNLVNGLDYVGDFYVGQTVKGVVCGEFQILSFRDIAGEPCADVFNITLRKMAVMPLDALEVVA